MAGPAHPDRREKPRVFTVGETITQARELPAIRRSGYCISQATRQRATYRDEQPEGSRRKEGRQVKRINPKLLELFAEPDKQAVL